MQLLYHSSLVVHLVGLALMAGISLVDYVFTRRFANAYAEDPAKGIAIYPLLMGLARMIGIGAVLLLLSGIGMMLVVHTIVGQQLWFQIKIGLVVLILINSIAIGRRQKAKLGHLISTQPAGPISEINRNLRLYHLAQLTLFLTIIFLSAFKFN